MKNERNEQVEKLLRAERGVELPPDFKQRVMQQIHALPAPELLVPRRSWRNWVYALKLLSSGEKVAAGLIVAGAVALLLPGSSELLALLEWQLADFQLSVSVGETVASASLLSVIVTAAGALFMTGVGAFAAKNHLIGA